MIRTKPIRNFINARECLLLKTPHANGCYYGETDVLPKTYDTAADAIRGTDDFIQAIRFDMETLTGEDVTEECATAWLDDWKGTPADPVPAFVNSSEAFQTWSRAYDQEHPGWQGPDPDQQRQEWLDEEYRYEHLHASERVRPERNYTLHLIHG
ncbi:hypothetical protein GYN07_20785 [Rhizobium leguminosarum bv. viciae 248]|uniref:hypothetical protein n=1 Tax=Rhizobium leguminosarum TaxID=384 RepID=UPI00036A9185|nr:hypothetical protein [Rhizobium leguminosarum]QHW26620.1 hypothetical protein GYN07_20785 [Rhizobium leguminosarum bv. viciae 248]